jgi:hypothetical protein
VVLMNYKTKLVGVTNLSRETLYASVRQKGSRPTMSQLSTQPSRSTSRDTKWIAKVFRTGNIILTGMTTASECQQLMDSLREVIA